MGDMGAWLTASRGLNLQYRYLGKREVIRSVVIGLAAAVIEVGHNLRNSRPMKTFLRVGPMSSCSYLSLDAVWLKLFVPLPQPLLQRHV